MDEESIFLKNKNYILKIKNLKKYLKVVILCNHVKSQHKIYYIWGYTKIRTPKVLKQCKI
jgi:hypothetical protein